MSTGVQAAYYVQSTRLTTAYSVSACTKYGSIVLARGDAMQHKLHLGVVHRAARLRTRLRRLPAALRMPRHIRGGQLSLENSYVGPLT